MTNILIGMVIGLIGGLLIYRYFLDKPDKVFNLKKPKLKGRGNEQTIDIDFDNPKAIGRISADMSRREVIKYWKSLKNL